MSGLAPTDYKSNISKSGISIYDPIEIADDHLWIPSAELEVLLTKGLQGVSLKGLPLRTRSKVVKSKVCDALGYPIPTSFKKSTPRFPGQLFDTYIQKSNNLQVWNEELSPTRRYVIIRVSQDDRIQRIRVVTGDTLALLDTTGTLTQKYQARLIPGHSGPELITKSDTENLIPLLAPGDLDLTGRSPIEYPDRCTILPIKHLFERLSSLPGEYIDLLGSDQERRRGALLHELISSKLGFSKHQDDGRFPDIRQQLMEVKLQTSPTIDLGLVRPDSTAVLDIPKIGGKQLRHCDVRYAVCEAVLKGKKAVITNV